MLWGKHDSSAKADTKTRKECQRKVRGHCKNAIGMFVITLHTNSHNSVYVLAHKTMSPPWAYEQFIFDTEVISVCVCVFMCVFWQNCMYDSFLWLQFLSLCAVLMCWNTLSVLYQNACNACCLLEPVCVFVFTHLGVT